jgi:lysophospholipase L1-like esterase
MIGMPVVQLKAAFGNQVSPSPAVGSCEALLGSDIDQAMRPHFPCGTEVPPVHNRSVFSVGTPCSSLFRSVRAILTAGIFFIASVVSTCTARADSSGFFLRDGDRVVFLGDSITEQGKPGETDRGGLYTVYIESYALTRFPRWNLTFRNVGIGGDSAMLTQRLPARVDWEAFKAGDEAFRQRKTAECVGIGLERDVLQLRPTIVTIAFGMNDFGYRPYDDWGFQRYVRAETELLRVLQSHGCRAALFTTQPIEQPLNAPDSTEAAKNVTLRKYADGLKQVAATHGVPFVDRFDPYMAMITRARAMTPPENVGAGLDAVHPGPAGHAIMAWCILKELGAPGDVSSATIDVATGKVVASDKCRISDVTSDVGGVLAFRREDDILPMPLDPRAEAALRRAPIVEDLNRYMLKVTGLKEGRYEVWIDGEKCATVDAATLNTGWNMAMPGVSGPVTAQTRRVMELVLKKNALFYHRWREVQLDPARQRELPSLDTRLSELETQINAARQPQSHVFAIKTAAP